MRTASSPRLAQAGQVFVFITGFVLGILFSSFVSVSPIVGYFSVAVGCALLVGEKTWNKTLSKEVLFLSLIILSFGLGVLRYSIKDFHEPIIPEPTGIVVSEPEEKENSTSFVLLSDNGEKILVSTGLYSSVQYGDRVEVNGELEKPGIIEDENGRQFDYAKYLSKDDIYYTLSFAETKIISHKHGNPVKNLLFNIKISFISKIKEILAEPHASLLAGLVVSGKEAMPKDILEEFRRAGIIHIVVLSGYNITIIAEFMRRLFLGFFLMIRIQTASRFAALASIVGIIFFVLMTGAEATVVRAAIMVLTVIVAKMFGKNYSASRALLVAGTLMLVENPKVLVFDPSFQLSFLATLGLIYLAPIFEKYLATVPEKFGLRMIITTTLATQVMVLPFLIYSIGDFSLISLPANILVLLTIPLTMFLGFLATILAYLSSILALPLAYGTHLLLSWILWVSHTLGNLSFASIAIPPIPWWIIALVYLAIFIFLWRSRNSLQHSAS